MHAHDQGFGPIFSRYLVALGDSHARGGERRSGAAPAAAALERSGVVLDKLLEEPSRVGAGVFAHLAEINAAKHDAGQADPFM